MLGLVLKSESRYKVIENLEQGSRGEVYLVEKLQLGRRYRLKVLPTGILKTICTDPELEILTQWEHSGILRGHDCFRHGKDLFLVQDHVPGMCLKKVMNTEQTGEDEARMLLPLLETLSDLHQHGFLHGNLRPEYLWVDDRRQLLITDFGHAVRRQGTAPWRTPETHDCLAPERKKGRPGGPDADLYAVGALLRLLSPQTNKKLNSIVARATAPRPLDRFQDAKDFIRALTDALQPNLAEEHASTLFNTRPPQHLPRPDSPSNGSPSDHVDQAASTLLCTQPTTEPATPSSEEETAQLPLNRFTDTVVETRTNACEPNEADQAATLLSTDLPEDLSSSDSGADTTARLPRSYFWGDPNKKKAPGSFWDNGPGPKEKAAADKDSRSPFETLLKGISDESEEVDEDDCAENRLLHR